MMWLWDLSSSLGWQGATGCHAEGSWLRCSDSAPWQVKKPRSFDEGSFSDFLTHRLSEEEKVLKALCVKVQGSEYFGDWAQQLGSWPCESSLPQTHIRNGAHFQVMGLCSDESAAEDYVAFARLL
jgi:hypothetical protein